MADSLNTNPIVVDLNTTTTRQIASGTLFVKSILVSGQDGALDPLISLREASGSGTKQFQYAGDTSVSPIHQQSFDICARLENPFFVNDEGTAWTAGAVMLIYLT